jgi:hypothetical protein
MDPSKVHKIDFTRENSESYGQNSKMVTMAPLHVHAA